MKLTVVSNYINHHQIPVARELYDKLKDDYVFIQTEPMEEERVKMGWASELDKLPFLKLYYKEPEVCSQLIMESDIVIFGGVEDEAYIQPRLQAGKIVIRMSERLYKEGQWKSISPRGRKKKYEDHGQYRDASVYLLCCGAYVASDFELIHAYPDKKFTWGYFPKVYEYDLKTLFFKKLHLDKSGKKSIRLLWAGRFIDWKHPEYAVKAARDLKKKGISFQLDMVGGGDMEEYLKKLVAKYHLEEEVIFHGFQPPQNVRRYMEETDIFLFTSDYQEGWGAVLNEAMNSACAVVAGHGIGATPYLVRHEVNGLVYKNKCYREFREQVLALAANPELCKKLGIKAYETMVTTWNPKEAAKRLYAFCEGLMQGELICQSDDGPMGKAPDIAPCKGYQYVRR
ncbi:MAG: glycosyltransferase family 4 protein [Lachnospiraceae bacterium]|nr:glycosyltransferase family 4 protein [Lachnospiraceae bacterium]